MPGSQWYPHTLFVIKYELDSIVVSAAEKHNLTYNPLKLSKYFSKKNFKTVQDVLDFLLENGGRTTNTEIVKHFGQFFQSSTYSQTNKVSYFAFCIPVFLYPCIPA